MSHRPPDSLAGELVQQHAKGLRAIAHGLLSDAHAADEVVQETWVAAIERPPVDSGRIGGWLRQVTRRTALKRRRGETRRSRREHEASRPESLAPTDEVVAQREVLRRVMDAVLGLEEPYQTVVLMRFYQDLPPREIARRRGAKVVTVNSQIQRALEKLRGHLDADGEKERGHWACALAAATGWERGIPVGTTPAARPGIERWAMDWRLWMGATGAAAVVAIGTTTAEPGVERGASGPALVATAAAPDVRGTQTTGDGQEANAGAGQSARQPAVDPAEPAEDEGRAADARGFELSGQVVDENDRPVPGAHVFVAPLLQPLCDLGECDGEGRFRVAWLGEAPRMQIALAIHKNGYADAGIQELTLAAGSPTEVRVATRSAMIGWDASAVDVSFGEDGAEQKKRRNEKLRLTEELFDRYYPRVPIHVDEAGLATFQWPVENLLVDDHNEIDVELSQEELRRRKEAHRAASGGVFFEDVTEEEIVEEKGVERGPLLVVDVLDARGEPVAGAPVELIVDGNMAYFLRTREDGSLEHEVPLGARSLTMHAGGGDFGVASGQVDLLEDDKPVQRAYWRAALDRGNEVRGAFTVASDASLADWIVEFRGGDGLGTWTDTTEVAGDGFAIPNLPVSSGTLFLRRGRLEVLPRIVIPHVDAGHDPATLAFEVEDPGTGSLRVALADVHGEAIKDADVRVWQQSSGRAVRMRYDAKNRQYEHKTLPAGRYRVTAGSLTNGYRDLGQVEVLAGEEASLGSAALATAGALVFEDVPDVAKWELYLRANGVQTLVAWERGATPFEGHMPAGEYVLRLTDKQGEVTTRELEVRAGESTSLDE